MAFFGFDSSRHNPSAPGFSQAHDPFAGLSNNNNDGDALDFEDTYDGLGDKLDETDDAFNDDTNSNTKAGLSSVGKDFDFFGQTAKVADAFEEEHLRFNQQQPKNKTTPKPTTTHDPTNTHIFGASVSTARPARSGYEKYTDPEPEPEIDSALWGVAPKKPPPAPAQPAQPAQPAASGGRKVMSLEEVEAAMRAQTKKPAQPVQPQIHYNIHEVSGQPVDHHFHHTEAAVPQAPTAVDSRGAEGAAQHHGHGHPMTILQRPQSKQAQSPMPKMPSPINHHQQPQQQQPPPPQPTHILQNPNRLSGDAAWIGVHPPPPHGGGHRQQNSFSQPPFIPHPSQVANMSEDEKAAYLEQEAKRAKRNHKIFLLSKDNGLMTPQDKNFVTRIQLQQLVAATGNPNEHGTDEALSEDFYYQVLSQIRGGQRQHPSQPLNNFAQTYLYQTGSRQPGMRRHNRGPENHMQRMEQQVQRAVEAAKNKPKNKQLVIEGSLGKISFSTAKTPKPLLNITRPDSSSDIHRPSSAHAHKATPGAGQPMAKKTVLRDIERVYSTLMKMEDHARRMPPRATSDGDLALLQRQVEWSEAAHALNAQLWNELKVHEPIGATPVHPFIAFLSFPKGTKAIPRVFRHTTHEQRTTILTMVVVHLDQLDIVRGAQISTGETRLNAALRVNLELFSLNVMS